MKRTKYLKLNPNITKEQLKPIQDKIKELGLIDHIDFYKIKKGYNYIYRSCGTETICNYCCGPHIFNKKTRNAEKYGDEISIEDFLKLK